jgi:hypothetical protein
MAALPVALLMQWFMFYFDQRLELQKSEIQNCIYSSLADIKMDSEWQFILKNLINSKKLNSEQCFKLATIIQNGCRRINIKPEYFLALMMVESEMNSKCVFMGARGICQVMDCTKMEAIGITQDYKWDDPIKNTLACILYLEYMRGQKHLANETDTLLFMQFYNRGPFWSKPNDKQGLQYRRKLIYWKEQIK